MTDRPVYGITVLRYADERTEVRDHVFLVPRIDEPLAYAPTAWQHRHAMLIDACEVVKREAGVSEPAFQSSATIASAEQGGAMKKPTNEELHKIAEGPAEALSARTGLPALLPRVHGEEAMRQLGRDINRALHDAGIQWAVDALRNAPDHDTEKDAGEWAAYLEKLAKEAP